MASICHMYADNADELLTLNRNQIKGLELVGLTLAELESLLPALQVSPTLVSLSLSGGSFGDQGARLLAKLLEHNQVWRTLSLRDNQIGDEGAQALAQALHSNQTLTTLDLRENDFGETASEPLLAALNRHPSLKELFLPAKFY